MPSALGLFDVVPEGENLIKIIIAGGSEKPYYKKKYGMTEKGCFIRIGNAAEPMPQKMIDELFSSRTRNSIRRMKSPRQEMTFEQLHIYYNEKKKTLNRSFKTNLELLTQNNELNYVSYLLADENNVSIKIAKYGSETRTDLIENNEYGYCSLIKATKQVLEKIEIENKTFAKITSRERIEKQLWNAVALREAILNAIVHNDYSRESEPKIEIFPDRIEITSTGSLPEGLSKDEFFEGFSVPRNKELMRIFKDLELVEQLGSGIPRILESYGKECFTFSENFTRVVFYCSPQITPQVTPQVTLQVTPQVEKLVMILKGELSRIEIQQGLGLTDKKNFNENYLYPALKEEIIELTVPDKPKSSKQKYRLTLKGKKLKKTIK
jgi:predicted HTH transcriptional regulator